MLKIESLCYFKVKQLIFTHLCFLRDSFTKCILSDTVCGLLPVPPGLSISYSPSLTTCVYGGCNATYSCTGGASFILEGESVRRCPESGSDEWTGNPPTCRDTSTAYPGTKPLSMHTQGVLRNTTILY